MINNAIDLVYEDNAINKSVVHVYCASETMAERLPVWDLYISIIFVPVKYKLHRLHGTDRFTIW